MIESGPPMEPPHDFSALIAVERAALLDVLRSMSLDDWDKPSPCPGWSVHDLVMHLVGADVGVIARNRDNHYRTSGPDPTSEIAFEHFLNDLNHQWVVAMRRTSPQQAIAMLRSNGEELVELYRNADPSIYDSHVAWASNRPLPRWFDQAREFTERWVHHQQILDAIEASSWIDAEMTGVVLDTFQWAYLYRLGHLTRPAGVTAGIDITGEVERNWRWTSSGIGWAPSEEQAQTLVTMPTRTAWRLLTNGLDPREWPSPSPAGDTAIARTLLRTRAILGTPNG